MRHFHSAIAALVLAFALCPAPALAGAIQIQLTGLDLVYDGFDIYDAGDPLGGNGDPAESDPLASAQFFLNGALVGTLTSQIYADFAIVGVPLPAGGGVVTSPFGGFFDLLTSDLGWGVGLNFDSFQVSYNPAGAFLTGTGGASSIAGQNLPFGLLFDGPVSVAFSAQLRNVTTSGGAVTGFTGSGLATVPEPATISMLVVGVALLGRRARMRVVRRLTRS